MASFAPLRPTPVCRILKRTLLDTRWSARLPVRSVTTLSTDADPEPLLRLHAHPLPDKFLPTTPKVPSTPSIKPPRRKRKGPPPPPIPESTAPRSAPPKPEVEYRDAQTDESMRDLLPMLRLQPPFYTQIHIHEKPYLVTVGDTIRLPFRMPGVDIGDVLRLNRATLIGSRDYTLKAGQPQENAKRGWIDERLFVVRARVMGVEMEPLRIKEKTQRRQRHVKTAKSKHQYTVLRVMEVSVNDVDDVPGPFAPADAGASRMSLSRNDEEHVRLESTGETLEATANTQK